MIRRPVLRCTSRPIQHDINPGGRRDGKGGDWKIERERKHVYRTRMRFAILCHIYDRIPHTPFQSVQHKNPRKQMVLANRQQNGCAGSSPSSWIKFLPACENAYDSTRLCDDVHHGLDSRRSLHHPSAASAAAAAMVVIVMVVVMVLGWPTVFWRHAAIRARGDL